MDLYLALGGDNIHIVYDFMPHSQIYIKQKYVYIYRIYEAINVHFSSKSTIDEVKDKFR